MNNFVLLSLLFLHQLLKKKPEEKEEIQRELMNNNLGS